MTWPKFACGFAFFGGCALVLSATAGGPVIGSVEGRWGGKQVQLVIDANGGRLQTDCSSGTLSGPLRLSDQGTFSALGTFDQHQPGPQRADEAVQPVTAQFSGEIKDGVMSLSVIPEGGGAAQQFLLRKGQGGKVVRCL